MGLDERSVQDLQAQFTGELQVKLILTGLGSNIADLAKSTPVWATGGSRSVFFCFATSSKLHLPYLALFFHITPFFGVMQT